MRSSHRVDQERAYSPSQACSRAAGNASRAPAGRCRARCVSRWAPRVRGARAAEQAMRGMTGTIPARAGSTALGGFRPFPIWDHPRACGEHHQRTPCIRPWSGPSPRVRGALPAPSRGWPRDGTIPTRAGSTADARDRRCMRSGPSPRVRGALADLRAEITRLGTIPARAGSTYGSGLGAPQWWDHPRACGEHSTESGWTSAGMGPSPRVRGAPGWARTRRRSAGTIPARAGSTLSRAAFMRRLRDHPRACGEHLREGWTDAFGRGPSPRVRGAHTRAGVHAETHGTIPARAGSTSPYSTRSRSRWDHPRACGEHF